MEFTFSTAAGIAGALYVLFELMLLAKGGSGILPGLIDRLDANIQALKYAAVQLNCAFDRKAARLTGVILGCRLEVGSGRARLEDDALPSFGLSINMPGRDGFRPFATGDDRLSLVQVRGPEENILAALDGPTRMLLAGMTASGEALLLDGKACEWRSPAFSDPGRIVDAVMKAVELSRHFPPQKDIPAALARNARGDDSAGVRLRNLAVLQEKFPSHPLVAETNRALLKDEDPRLRFQAASRLGEEGAAALREAEAFFASQLGQKSDDEQIAAARALGEAGTVAAVDALLRCINDSTLLEGEVKRECRAAVARIQKRLGNVDPGGLSLATPAPQDGALSLGEESGGLSLPETGSAAPPDRNA